jgi:hypothetical protein
MLEQLLSSLQMTLSVLGLLASPDFLGGGGLPVALAVAFTVASATVALLAVLALADPGRADTSPPHPRRAIDVSALLTQSDPDAAGRPRPRAPQIVASAT